MFSQGATPAFILEAMQQRQEERMYEVYRLEAENDRAAKAEHERTRHLRLVQTQHRHDMARHIGMSPVPMMPPAECRCHQPR